MELMKMALVHQFTDEELQVSFLVNFSKKTMVGSWELEPQTSTVSKRRHYVLPTTSRAWMAAQVRVRTPKPKLLQVKLQVKFAGLLLYS
jgi:hypothetical protein